jgi:hypothetical protein
VALGGLKRWPFTAASMARACGSVPMSRRPSRLPSMADNAAVNASPRGDVKSPSIDQYSWVRNASISNSRSQTSRSATDCTRPAERAPGSLRHNTGERENPTR